MQPGQLDRRVTFRKRVRVGGQLTDELADHLTCWAAWRPLTAQQLVEGGAMQDAIAGTLTIPDTPRSRAIAMDDRAVFAGSDFAVISAAVPDCSGLLALQLSRRPSGT